MNFFKFYRTNHLQADTRRRSLLFDARWLRHSGIGTTVKYLLTQLSQYTHLRIVILSMKYDLTYIREILPSADIVTTTISGMSFAEQIILPFVLPWDIDYFYSPVYIKPLIHPGRLVVTIHDILHVRGIRFFSNPFLGLYAYILLLHACYFSVRITCDTQFTLNELRSAVPFLNLNKVIVAYPGFKSLDLVKNLNIPSSLQDFCSKPYFLFVGNLKPHKNLPTLLQAFISSNSSASCNLIIVGKMSGLRSPAFHHLTPLLARTSSIHLIGIVDDGILAYLYANALAFVFPSFYEGFGLPPLEALSLGTPVISSSAAPMPEVLSTYPSYFDPTDIQALSQLLDDHFLNNQYYKQRLSASSASDFILTRYTWPVFADKLFSILAS